MLAVDLLLQGRRGATTMTLRQAAIWSRVWVSLSLLFNAGLWWYLSETMGRVVADKQALAFLTGYLIEKALAVDNVFVWLMLFSYFSVPPNLQRRVLVYGVLGAIVLRTIMIFAGSWLVTQFQWILYVFGAFLLFTGVKMALAKDDDGDIGDKPLVRWIRSHLRMTDKIGSACDVLLAGGRGRTFLNAEIWSVGDSGVYRLQDADYGSVPHPNRGIVKRSGWNFSADAGD